MKQVVVQGLGFVGLAMSIAIASSSDQKGSPLYNVIGLDLPSKEGHKKVDSINNGQLPLKSSDISLITSVDEERKFLPIKNALLLIK